MPDSLNLVFQYFLAVGSGIGLGLVLTIGGVYVAYKKFSTLQLRRTSKARK